MCVDPLNGSKHEKSLKKDPNPFYLPIGSQINDVIADETFKTALIQDFVHESVGVWHV